MRSTLLYNRKRPFGASVNGIVSVYFRVCTDMFVSVWERTVIMIESKPILALIAIIGVPAFISTWFTNFSYVFADVYGWVDPAKTIILAAIAIGAGLFFLIRSGIKTVYAIWEFIDKFKVRYKKK